MLSDEEPEEQAADERDAEGAAELLGGAEDARGLAGLVARNGRQHDVDERHDEQPEAGAGDHETRHERPRVAGQAQQLASVLEQYDATQLATIADFLTRLVAADEARKDAEAEGRAGPDAAGPPAAG